MSAHGAFLKLLSGAENVPADNKWKIGVKKERKDDPLLQYMHQARNAEEHSLGASIRLKLGSVRYIPVNAGGSFSVSYGISVERHRVKTSPLEFESENGDWKMECVPATAYLVEVTNDKYGDTFSPPTTHKGIQLQDTTPSGVAAICYNYLFGMVGDAQMLVPGFKPPF